MMRSVSGTQKNTNLSELDSGDCIDCIGTTTSVSTATICRDCCKEDSDLGKMTGGHGTKDCSGNVWDAMDVIWTQKAETAVEVTRRH